MLRFEEHAVYLFTRPVDMRCGFDRLSELAQTEVGKSPLQGGLFVFVSRCRRRMKLLVWEGDGYWLLYKRLEVGVFHVEHLPLQTTCSCCNGELSRIGEEITEQLD